MRICHTLTARHVIHIPAVRGSRVSATLLPYDTSHTLLPRVGHAYLPLLPRVGHAYLPSIDLSRIVVSVSIQAAQTRARSIFPYLPLLPRVTHAYLPSPFQYRQPKPGPGPFFRRSTAPRDHHTTNFCVSPCHRSLFSSSLLLLVVFKARSTPSPAPSPLRLLSPSTLQPTTAPRPVLGLAVLSTRPTLARAAPCSSLPKTVGESRRSCRPVQILSLPAGGVCFSSERPEGSSWPEPWGGAASAACMEAKVCPSVLFPLISHSFVLSLGGPRCSRLVPCRAVPRFAMGLLPWGTLLGSAVRISSVITRSRRVSLGSYPCFVPRGRAFLGAGSGVDLVGRVSWPRACARFLLSAAGGRLLGFHGVCRIRSRG